MYISSTGLIALTTLIIVMNFVAYSVGWGDGKSDWLDEDTY